MDKQPKLPAHVVACGRALRPTLAKVVTTLLAAPQRRRGEVATIEMVAEHMRRIDAAVDDIGTKVRVLGSELVGANEAGIHRAVGALETHLEALQDGYLEVLAWGGAPEERRGRNLLAEVYRDLLTQVKDWLEELVEVIERPLAAVERRGLSDEKDVVLTIHLTLRSPPDVEHLVLWARQQAGSEEEREEEIEEHHRRKSGLGFWGTVAATAVGFGLADLLFFDDE